MLQKVPKNGPAQPVASPGCSNAPVAVARVSKQFEWCTPVCTVDGTLLERERVNPSLWRVFRSEFIGTPWIKGSQPGTHMLLLEATEVASCYDERACALANSCAHVHAATSVLARWRIRASMFMLRRACLRAGAFVRPCSC
eukprot:gene13074-biopygen469